MRSTIAAACTAFALVPIPLLAETLFVSSDAYISQANPTTNYGIANSVESIDDRGILLKGYLKFDASSLVGQTVTDISGLTMFYSRTTNRTAFFSLLAGTGANSWTESGIDWNTAPLNNSSDVGFTAAEGQSITPLGSIAGNGQNVPITLTFDSAMKTALLNALNTGDRVATIAFQHSGTNQFGVWSKDYTPSGGSLGQYASYLTYTATPAPVESLVVSADAFISQLNPTTNYGNADSVESIDDPGIIQKGYLKFDASSLIGQTLTDIRGLKMFYSRTSNRTGFFSLLAGTGANSWTENGIDWNTAPLNNLSDVGFTAAEGQSITPLGSIPGNGQNVPITLTFDAAMKTALLNALNTGDRVATIAFQHSGTNQFGVWSKDYTPVGGLQGDYAAELIYLATAPTNTYASWASDNDIPGEPADGDFDNDGLDNAVEMVIGGHPANAMDAALLFAPVLVTDPAGVPAGNYFEFTFRRTNLSVSAGVISACEYNTGLDNPWTTALDGEAGVEIIDSPDHFGSGVARVQVYIPRGTNQKLFARLKVLVP